MSLAADSAGRPWAGRSFEPNPHAADDGSATPALAAALEAFAAGGVDAVAVVDALREARLLIPLIAELGDEGVAASGLRVDKSQELSIVTVRGPDGRAVLPVFSSVATMAAWNPSARPVPADGPRVALAAAGEGTELIVLDPGSPSEFAVRRPAVWAIARGERWMPSAADPEVLAALRATASHEPAVVRLEVSSGDPAARLRGPELVVALDLRPGLDRADVAEVVTRLQERWRADALLLERVDSVAVRVRAA